MIDSRVNMFSLRISLLREFEFESLNEQFFIGIELTFRPNFRLSSHISPLAN
jgi:hypothetical protein